MVLQLGGQLCNYIQLEAPVALQDGGVSVLFPVYLPIPNVGSHHPEVEAQLPCMASVPGELRRKLPSLERTAAF